MQPFWISEIKERHGEKTLYVNPLPEKYCTFDCVFCPIETRTTVKTDKSFKFEETSSFLNEIDHILSGEKVDQVFIMPDGEGLSNVDLSELIKLAKRHGSKVKIITNGYILNHPNYKELMLQCDEVIGELMTVTEENFQKLQRPIAGYTLADYVSNMAEFRHDFKGTFNLSITLLKDYSDSDTALEFFKEAVLRLKPKSVFIETPEEGKLKEAFGVDENTIARFEDVLNNI